VLNSSQNVNSANVEKIKINDPIKKAKLVTILSSLLPWSLFGKANKYKVYGNKKKETVPRSKNKPVAKILTTFIIENSILGKDHIYKDILTIKESIKKTNPKVESSWYLFGICKFIVDTNILTFIGFCEFRAIHFKTTCFLDYICYVKIVSFYEK
jgi:hypothetical protein